MTADALDKYGQQCVDILEHAARVQALDTAGVEPTSHPLPLANAFREDEASQDRVLPRDTVLARAPATEDVYFRVPPALEDE